ncbi:MAG: hypothetical protein Q3983_10110 [Capnocytophaga sp.]|nr:hypothetical protein [Capnocytophaga sp.]
MEENLNNMNTEKQKMDNGLELLNKVIKSNEENIEKLTDVALFHQDILNLVGEFESSAKSLNHKIEDFEYTFRKASQQMEKTIKDIPKNIEVNLSDNSLSILNNFEKKSLPLKYSLIGSFSSLGLAIIVMFLSFYFSKKWYQN